MSTRRNLSLGLALAALAVGLVALPASAHDQLVSSDPAAGSHVATPPAEITLTYSDAVLTLGEDNAGASVLVVDAAGANWVTGPLAVNGNIVTAALDQSMPANAYEVQWQVVSSDGHTISGTIPFTVDAPAATEPSATPQESSTGEPPVTPTVQASIETSADAALAQESADESTVAIRTIVIGVAVVVLAIIAVVLVGVIRRRRAG